MNERRHTRRPWLLALALAFCGLAQAQQQPGADPNGAPAEQVEPPSAPAPAAPAPPPPSPPAPTGPRNGASASITPVKTGEVLLNFQGADVQAVVKAVSQMTGRNFLMDPRVKGTVTIISSKPVSRANAYQIFLSALKAQGFTAVEGPGTLVRIVPTGEAKQGADVEKTIPYGEQINTHVAIVQHISASQMVPLLRPLMAPTSQLSAYEPANALIITDYGDNIRRLLKIIDKIDQPVSSDVTVVSLQHASALDLADLITRLAAPPGAVPAAPGQPAQAPVGDRFTIVPDLRTNTLLIRTDNPGRLNQLRSLIGKLDVPATTGGQTRVVYLRNAEAVKLVEVLRGLLAGEARAQTATAPAAPGVPGRPAARPAAEASLIQADEATNALIINASDAVYNNLRAVIEKLDVRRAQVYVEALIAEITTDKATELGFQWFDAGKAGDGAVAGVTNFTRAKPSIIGTAVDPTTALSGAAGLTLAFLGPSITLADGTEVRSLGALARALEQKTIANILSTPNLMTLDNAEAKIVVGQNVPFVTGNFVLPTTGTGTTTNPFQTIERRDVGITLRIKPQISEGGGVKLDIFQEISTVTASPVATADIVTNKRSVETKVLVDDGGTIVLGGLIEDTIQETRQEVPVLGRIPLLGALFRYKEDTKKKTNLMVFLRPVIIRSADDGYRLTSDRYDYIRAQGREPDRERVEMLERFKPAPPPAEPPKPTKPPEEKLGPPEAPDGSPTVN